MKHIKSWKHVIIIINPVVGSFSLLRWKFPKKNPVSPSDSQEGSFPISRLFGHKARNMMREMGGVGFVAIQLSETETLGICPNILLVLDISSDTNAENKESTQQKSTLRYESSTLILNKELSSSIFPLWVSQSVSQWGISNTCPDLHFAQYIKA